MRAETVSYSLASSTFGGKIMSIQGEWRALDEDRGVVGTSRWVVKDLQSVLPLSWNPGLSEPAKGELTEPRP